MVSEINYSYSYSYSYSYCNCRDPNLLRKRFSTVTRKAIGMIGSWQHDARIGSISRWLVAWHKTYFTVYNTRKLDNMVQHYDFYYTVIGSMIRITRTSSLPWGSMIVTVYNKEQRNIGHHDYSTEAYIISFIIWDLIISYIMRGDMNMFDYTTRKS